MSVEEASGVALATVRNSGLTIRYAEHRLSLDTVGEIAPEDVSSRDDGGLLAWTDQSAQDLFYIYISPEMAIRKTFEAITNHFDVVVQAANLAVDQLQSDLKSPVPSEQLRIAAQTALGVLSYVGVSAYVFAVLYLSRYYGQVAPGQVTAYPYVETIGATLWSSVPLFLVVLPLSISFASSVLGASRRTREITHKALAASANLTEECRRISEVVERLKAVRDRIAADGPLPGAAEVEEDMNQLDADAAAAVAMAADVSDTVKHLLRLLPRSSRIAIWLARDSQDRRNGLALFILAVAATQFIACLPLAVSIAVPSAVLGVLMRDLAAVLSVFAGAAFWTHAAVVDLVHGPGTRVARLAMVNVGAWMMVGLIWLVILLGISDGRLAVRYPATYFHAVRVETQNGVNATGYQVPLLGSSDILLLTPATGGAGASLVRYSPSDIRALRISFEPSSSAATGGR